MTGSSSARITSSLSAEIALPCFAGKKIDLINYAICSVSSLALSHPVHCSFIPSFIKIRRNLTEKKHKHAVETRHAAGKIMYTVF